MIKDRLLELCKELRMSLREFEMSIGVSNGCLSHISDKISLNVTSRIEENYPQVNIHWLRTGIGKMFNSSAVVVSHEKTDAVLKEIALQREMISRFQKQIDACQAHIDILLATLQEK